MALAGRLLGSSRAFKRSALQQGNSWFGPKISAALVSKHHWLIIASGTCGFIRAIGGLGARDAS